MLTLHIGFPIEKDAYFANTEVCKFFQGLTDFVENRIIVTPVTTEYITDHKYWTFDICFDDPDVDRIVRISGGELLLKNKFGNVWAFSFNGLENHVKSKNE